MKNTIEIMSYVLLHIVLLSVVLTALIPFGLATSIEPDIYDQWNTIEEFEKSASLRDFLVEKDWINENVSIEELDYILVLTQQCSEEFFPAVPMSLVLSIISIESGFNKDLTGFSNDTGLMQVIPRFHRDRIEKYIYDENVDLYDPRLNVMVGTDYLDELLNWARGDIERTVMAYNMGQFKADNLASAGHVTGYAREVLARMNAIDEFLERRN